MATTYKLDRPEREGPFTLRATTDRSEWDDYGVDFEVLTANGEPVGKISLSPTAGLDTVEGESLDLLRAIAHDVRGSLAHERANGSPHPKFTPQQ